VHNQTFSPLNYSEAVPRDEQSAQPFIRQAFRLSQYDAPRRVEDFLFDAYRRLLKANVIARPRYPLPLTQALLGELLGISAVHVSRVCKAIAPLIHVTQGFVHIEAPVQLAQMFPDDHAAMEPANDRGGCTLHS
jgi:hypothetical protein